MDESPDQRPVDFGATPVSAEFCGEDAAGAEEVVQGFGDGQAVLLREEDPVQGCVREYLVEAAGREEGAGWERCGV